MRLKNFPRKCPLGHVTNARLIFARDIVNLPINLAVCEKCGVVFKVLDTE
jgi:hypothetical protein